MIQVVLHGAGRMSAALADAARPDPDIEILAVVSPRPPAWENSLLHHPSLDQLEVLPDVLIDFSLPRGTAAAAAWCADSGVALLSGVTGLPAETHAQLDTAAEKIPVLWAPNLSIGVNLMAQLCATAAAVLGPDVPVSIDDLHHSRKLDAPSGTALMLGASLGRGRAHAGDQVSYNSRREGEAIGRHQLTFELPGETLSLTHEALDRAIFARGALQAARWLAGQANGRYSAADWLAG